MTRLKLGVIGCGELARLVHFPALRSLPDVTVTAIAEPDPRRRRDALLRVPSASVSERYQELLELPEVEAVLICAPSGLHAEIATAAMQMGKHVYLEKPLAVTLEEGRQVVASWRHAGVIGMIGFNYRFHPLWQALRQRLRERRLGELVGMRSVLCSTWSATPGWRQTRRSGGGALLELASHHIDLVHFLFAQDIQRVSTEVRSLRGEDDSVMLQLQLTDGLLVQSFFSLHGVEEDRVEIYGQKGTLVADRHRSLQVLFTGAEEKRSRLRLLRDGMRELLRGSHAWGKLRAPRREPSYRAALSHFVTSVRQRCPASPDFWDGYRSLAVLMAAEESARTGRVVPPCYEINEDSTRQ
jgi:predicted dehydrogenase